MEGWVCRTCGVQTSPSHQPPAHCAICADERHYVPPLGQQWATVAQLRAEGRHIEIRELEPRLTGVGADPPIGIGQRALLVQTPSGNLLWDCLGFIDENGVAAVEERGGLAGIAFSHPHFYGVCVEWSHAFGGAPVYVPHADREWVMRPDCSVTFWQGTLSPLPGLTLIQAGGHFEGSAALHWAGGANGRGALLTGDTITVVADRRFRQLHAELSERHPAVAGRGSANRGHRAAVRIRPDLRGMVGSSGRVGRQGRHSAVGRSVHPVGRGSRARVGESATRYSSPAPPRRGGERTAEGQCCLLTRSERERVP